MRHLSLIRVCLDLPDDVKEAMPFDEDETLCFLGEIPNMEGHCVVISCTTKKVHIGYHVNDFVELTEEEL